MLKILIATLALTTINPAMAWGDREQGILTGVAGMWLYQKLSKEPSQSQREVYSIYNSQPPLQPQINYIYTCYVQVQDAATGNFFIQQQVCLGR